MAAASGNAARFAQVKSLKNQALIADKCHVADCFADRLRGLIGRPALARGEAMFFPRCNSVHMWFMAFAIDVVFLRRKPGADGAATYEISSIRPGLRPWKALPVADWGASEALELPSGSARALGLAVGDLVCIG